VSGRVPPGLRHRYDVARVIAPLVARAPIPMEEVLKRIVLAVTLLLQILLLFGYVGSAAPTRTVQADDMYCVKCR